MNSTSSTTFRLRRRTPGSFVLVPCPRIGRALRCQGQLERAAALVIAACPHVTDVREQPLEIWYAWRETNHGLRVRLLDGRPGKPGLYGNRVSYIVPDFLVCMQRGTTRLIEVKPARRLMDEIVRRKLCVARLYALASDWTFHVLTEHELLRSALPQGSLARRTLPGGSVGSVALPQHSAIGFDKWHRDPRSGGANRSRCNPCQIARLPSVGH